MTSPPIDYAAVVQNHPSLKSPYSQHPIDGANAREPVMIAISIRNENASDVSTVTIIEVRDSEGFTTYLSWQSVMIEQD